MDRHPILLTLLGFVACLWIGVYPFYPFPQKLAAVDLNQRIESALQSTHGRKVVYTDVLGEGDGAWDSDPRYPVDKVNCVVWLREVISEVYGADLDLTEKTKIMDRLRYYGGQPRFSMRKHYGVRWLGIDPKPLTEVDLSYCADLKRRQVQLNLEHFQQYHRYSCPLFQMERQNFDFNYVEPDDLVRCSKKMEPGYYFLFAVASDYYVRKFGKSSGTLGLVHGIVLKVNAPPPGETDRELGLSQVFHASIAAKRVKQEDLVSYVENMRKRLHLGYVVYRLDPNWNYREPASLTFEVGDDIEACEMALAKRTKKKTEF